MKVYIFQTEIYTQIKGKRVFLKKNLNKFYTLLFLLVLILFSCMGTGEQTESNSKQDKNAASVSPPPPDFQDEDAESNIINYGLNQLDNLENASDLETVLCQAWDLREDYDDAYTTRGENYLDAVYRGYRFFDDKQVIKNFRSEYIPGNWDIVQKGSSKIIEMRFSNGQRENFVLANLSPYSLKLTREDDSKKELLEYVGNAITNKNRAEDPFSTENNLWRQKPTQPESKEALRKRLKDCIHFFVLYYDFNIESKAEIVNFVGLPTCFRWYAGGIYLLKEKEIPQNWIQCFYNKEQALEAFAMAGKLLDFSYQWPENETNWLKLNVSVLKQMEQRIDNLE